jgi:hypothetical protein
MKTVDAGVVIRRVLLVALGATVAAAVALATFSYPGPAPSSPGAPACASVLIVGLRGNGDAPSAGHGMGDDSWAVAGRVENALAGRLAMSAIGFPYDPGPPWRLGGHVRTAVAGLAAFAAERHSRCPVERLLLIGQSEGAATVHLTLARLGSQLAVAVLLADPLRVGGSAYDDLGGHEDGLVVHVLLGGRGGLGPVQDVVPAALAPRVRSYCLSADPVCDATPANLAGRLRRDVHTTYRFDPGGIAARAAAFAVTQLV